MNEFGLGCVRMNQISNCIVALKQRCWTRRPCHDLPDRRLETTLEEFCSARPLTRLTLALLKASYLPTSKTNTAAAALIMMALTHWLISSVLPDQGQSNSTYLTKGNLMVGKETFHAAGR